MLFQSMDMIIRHKIYWQVPDNDKDQVIADAFPTG